jgi:hypothetical protein
MFVTVVADQQDFVDSASSRFQNVVTGLQDRIVVMTLAKVTNTVTMINDQSPTSHMVLLFLIRRSMKQIEIFMKQLTIGVRMNRKNPSSIP